MDYITKSEKTDKKILVSSFQFHPSTVRIQFMKRLKMILYSVFLNKKEVD